ncbi:MAG: hypothetical protein NVSMB18_26590 [Acetobacteraceae bacterium]
MASLIALALLAFVLQDAFEVVLLPRRVNRRLRLTSIYFRLAWASWTRLALRLPAGRPREDFLSHFGALSMLGLFVLWAGTMITSFGILEWAMQGTPAPGQSRSPLVEQLYMSGVTFFTVGFGDVVPHTGATRLLAVTEGGTGIGFIAVVIGYLPVLYQLFSRREAHVIQLDGRAGSPPTATALLCRHSESGGLEKLDDFLRNWEVWAAELLESHLSYPMLAFYRSQHENQSWLAALAAVMDCCTLILVGVKELPPLQARMTFTMARQVVVEMAHSFAIEPSRYDGGDRLPADSYAQMEAAFADADLVWEGGDDGPVTLLALRATYEPLLDGLSRHLLLPLPGWIPDEGAIDHSERGHRGLLARRMIEQLSDRGVMPSDSGPDHTASVWRKLRRRLRVPS